MEQKAIPRPVPTGTDAIVRWLCTSSVIVAVYGWISRRLVPLLFAVFIAAPVGLLILPFFVPKFVRNRSRRQQYHVHLITTPLKRIAGTYSREGPSPSATT